VFNGLLTIVAGVKVTLHFNFQQYLTSKFND